MSSKDKCAPVGVGDIKPEELKVGLPVEVVFDDVTGEVTIPKFKLAQISEGSFVAGQEKGCS